MRHTPLSPLSPNFPSSIFSTVPQSLTSSLRLLPMAEAAAAAAAASANGLATRVPRRITEPSTSYSSAASRSQIRFGYAALKSNRLASGRGGTLNPRCSHGSENPMRSNEASSSMTLAASALEMLKTSAAERYTKEKSCIIVMGLNVHTAPVELREKFSIPEAQWPQAISELCALNHIEEAAVLSTCNRIEIYVQALSQSRGIKEVTEWMSKTSGVPESELRKRRFLLYDKDATRHLFEVASGLDSLVLGEGQILAQVKQVVKAGQGVAGFGRKIGGLFKNAITVGKRVRSETNIASGSVSVSSAAAELALMKLQEPYFSNARVLVIGAGKMGKLLIKHLIAKGCEKMVVVNRSEERVSAICEEFKNVEIIYKPFSEILSSAAEADVIFTSTASETPLFLKEQVRTLPPVRPKIGRRLFVDISVPRNVDSSVSDLETASVYDVDDLKEVVSANMEDRQQKAQEARVIIEDEVGKFEAWKDSQATVPTIKKFRAYVERIRVAEVEKCLSKLGDNISKKEKQAIYDLSMGIVNRLLRGPMEHLRCDGRNGCSMNEILENMRALDRMFDLQTETSVLEEKIRSKVEKNSK